MNRQTAMLVASAAISLALGSNELPAQTEDAIVRFSTGVEFSSGSYGGIEDIEEVYVPLTTRIDYKRLGFRLTVPYLSVNIPSAGKESGLGDIVGSMTLYDVYVSEYGDFVLDVTGTAKFGTADVDTGLGTGENDYSAQFQAYRFFNSFTALASAGYRLRGEPAGVELNDVFFGSVGGAYRATDTTHFGLYYDYRESALSDGDAIQELSGSVSQRLSDRSRLEVYAFTGFGDNSPDWGGGLLLSTDLRSIRVSDRH
jgi:hypothetical protein